MFYQPIYFNREKRFVSVAMQMIHGMKQKIVSEGIEAEFLTFLQYNNEKIVKNA